MALAELFVARHPVEEAVFFPFAVDGVAVVVQTIGDQQAAGLDGGVNGILFKPVSVWNYDVSYIIVENSFSEKF